MAEPHSDIIPKATALAGLQGHHSSIVRLGDTSQPVVPKKKVAHTKRKECQAKPKTRRLWREQQHRRECRLRYQSRGSTCASIDREHTRAAPLCPAIVDLDSHQARCHASQARLAIPSTNDRRQIMLQHTDVGSDGTTSASQLRLHGALDNTSDNTIIAATDCTVDLANGNNADNQFGGTHIFQIPKYSTAAALKRFAVSLSVLCSIVALIVSAFISTGSCATAQSTDSPPERTPVCHLVIITIAFNGASMVLGAITSLDWEVESTYKRNFGEMLKNVRHTHDSNGHPILLQDFDDFWSGRNTARSTSYRSGPSYDRLSSV